MSTYPGDVWQLAEEQLLEPLVYVDRMEAKDPEGLERAVRAYAKVFPEVPTPSPEGVKTMLDDLAPRNPKAQGADPRQYVDLSFVHELESSGFIKRLYGK